MERQHRIEQLRRANSQILDKLRDRIIAQEIDIPKEVWDNLEEIIRLKKEERNDIRNRRS